MPRILLGVPLSIGCLVGAQIARGDVTPSFTWDDVWTPTVFMGASVGPMAVAGVALGATAPYGTVDFNATLSNPVVVRAMAASVSDPNLTSTSEAQIDLERDFTLDGSPAGWEVSLFGILGGALFARSLAPNVRGSASVDALARIGNDQGYVLSVGNGVPPPWEQSLTPLLTGVGPPAEMDPVLAPLVDSGVLSDGTYTVFVQLGVSSSSAQSAGGVYGAGFFTEAVGVQATPIPEPTPEPATWLLLGTALGLIGARRVVLRR
jgi:hypothetical protein